MSAAHADNAIARMQSGNRINVSILLN
jgi:hypothetical protein